VEQTRALLLGLAGPYEGDWAAATLKGPAAAALLAKATLYIRAPLESFESELTLGHAAESSFRDAFALCLHAPPEKRTEKALAGRARAAAGGEALDAIAHIERVDDALSGVRFLSSDWEARVRGAETEQALVKLADALRAAPLEATLRASQAELARGRRRREGRRWPHELDGAALISRIFLFDGKTAAPLAPARCRPRPRRRASPTPRASMASSRWRLALLGATGATVSFGRIGRCIRRTCCSRASPQTSSARESDGSHRGRLLPRGAPLRSDKRAMIGLPPSSKTGAAT
jgi:hypothetical protein